MATKKKSRKKSSTRGAKKYVNEEWSKAPSNSPEGGEEDKGADMRNFASERESEAPYPVQKKTEPLIHILVRTHQRPEYFKRCIKSIAAQNYENKIVHVIADDEESEAYARQTLDDGLVDEVTRVDAKNLTGFGDFNFLQRKGYCKSRTDFRKHFYDLYLNAGMNRIENGYIFIVDDDKELSDAMLLNRISGNLAENVVVVGQYVMEKRTLPVGERWGKLPFERAHIDMSCVVFHVKHKEVAKLDGHGAGDWRMCNRLAKQLKVVWMEEPFVVADNNGNNGRSEQKISKK